MPPGKRQRQVDPDSDGETQYVKKTKSEGKAKAKKELGKGTDGDGNAYWEIGGTRRAGLSNFSGKTFVNIREYYTTNDGETKPGKKGISLSVEQYQGFLKIIPELNNELRAKGHSVEDPGVTSSSGAVAASSSPAQLPAKKASVKKAKKLNIEETSDEDDDDDDE
ncbi:transcriptional Coactivator p15-domain-containing protein [Apodospora peruviana]|uniref:Transcriptional Coactivator p15-domain-containing protein n=1 Tax=Apodospora peruviana TaxID=516989 RepID=A0AAE0MBQ5_9PEZI|nr:transcriptional Coactivator p15-domain-containing protein [Apodospora peruviana]